MEKRQLNKDFEKIGLEVIRETPELEHVQDSDVRIAFLESDFPKKSGGKPVMGECEKVMCKNKWAINYDFTITIYTKNIEHLNDTQIRILLLHELLHIGIKTGADGAEEYCIVPHDLEDFKTVVNAYGTDWDKAE